MKTVGRYELAEELGHGASGRVYRGRDPDTKRDVALKLVAPPPPGPDHDRWRVRLERELEASRRLAHPNVVRVLDAFEDGGTPVIVMELVRGPSLRDLLVKEGKLAPDRALEIVEALARGLHHAHEKGLIHRDLKPENVILDERGEPRIIDFGLTKDWAAPGSLTESGAILGTPGYLSPEQTKGAKDLDPRSDVWALGLVLYELLDGHNPFEGETLLDVLVKICRFDPPSPTPGRAGELALWALSKDRESRPATALELARALHELRAKNAGSGAWRRRLLALALGAPVLLVGALLFSVRRGASDPAKADVAAASSVTVPERAPTSSAAWEERGAEKERRGDHEGAIADFGKAIELDPRLAAAWEGRAGSKAKKEDLDGAIVDFTRAIGLDPPPLTAFIGRASAKKKKGDMAGAIADCSKAIELDPGFARAWFERGVAKAEQGDLEAGAADLTAGMELDPGLGAVWRDESAAVAARGNRGGVLNNAAAAITLSHAIGRAWAARGLAKVRANDRDGAIAALTKAIEVFPELARAWGDRGWAKRAKGDWDGAIADCTKAVALDPRFGEAWGHLGSAKEAKGDLDGAISDLTKALELEPRLTWGWGGRARAKETKGDLDGAIADYTKTTELEPRLAWTWRERGRARELEGDRDGAIADYKASLACAPDGAEDQTRKQLADLEAKAGK